MITDEKKQTIKLVIAVFILVLILAIVGIMMIKYEVEGEVNMPFKLSKILVIGTAEGIEKGEASWEFSIYQNNDVYFYIDENTDDENLLIKNVTISNIQITNLPQKGTIKTYMPNSEAGRLYNIDEQFLVGEKLQYKGASQSSSTNLEIGSRGGTALIRFSNTNISNYIPDKKDKILHDGTLLKEINVTKAEIKFTVSFDFIIETTKNKYKTNMVLDLPTGNVEQGNCNFEKTDMSDLVFKRVK